LGHRLLPFGFLLVLAPGLALAAPEKASAGKVKAPAATTEKAAASEPETAPKPVAKPVPGLAPPAVPAPDQPKPPADPAQRRAWLRSALDEVLGAPALSKVKMSVLAIESDTGRAVYGRGEKAPMNAASNVKIVTSAAALSLLGPEYRWKTITGAAGATQGAPLHAGELNGDLYLRGGGDPALSTEDLSGMAADLAAMGLHKVRGAIVVDETFFDGAHVGPAYDQKNESYASRAPSSAASLNGNVVAVTVVPATAAGAPARIVIEPASPYFTLGGRVDRVVYHGQISRGTFEFVDASNILLRQVTFQNALPFGLGTTESSAYVQDRWSVYERLVIEAGGRWDHDGFLRKSMFSPRVAGSVLVARASETKFTAGVGVYYDRTNLALASQAVQGSRTDVFLSPTAQAITVSFLVDPTRLPMPRFTNWSLGLERRLPGRIYARLDFLSRHGANGWAYEGQPNGVFQLGNNKRDRYDAAQITLRKELKRGYPFMISYTRSQARSNESVDFSLDNFTTGTQVGGPLAWDAPNLVNAWGSTPLFWKLKKFDFACSMLWHSGFPFITIDQFGRLVAGPAAHRFPDYFTLNPAVERKFVFRGYRWAARVGLDDATDRQNATVVDNNINSPSFLAFFGTSHRTINGRIRFLGKK